MSGVVKRSVTIRGHRTSFSIEQPFFDELVAIAARRRLSLAALIEQVDRERSRGDNLSSALRLLVLNEVRRAAARPASASDH